MYTSLNYSKVIFIHNPSEIANLPGKKSISTTLLTWNTCTKTGPKGMKIPIKLVETKPEEDLKRISEPKLKDYLTIEDIK